MQKQSYFVIAAMVASELHQATLIAQSVSLTASNARALAMRAGRSSAGFRAITEYIDELAAKTILISRQISDQAVAISRLASEGARTQAALSSFIKASELAVDAEFVNSIEKFSVRVQEEHESLMTDFDKRVWRLASDLENLSRELQTADVLSTMSKVEASQTSREYEESLTVIADSVQSAAVSIAQRVTKSQHMFSRLKRN